MQIPTYLILIYLACSAALSGLGVALVSRAARPSATDMNTQRALGYLLALLEILPALRRLTFAPRHFLIGGLLSGFFGGLAGMQGALRSAFLVRAGLSKQQFVGTGAAIACLIDITRLGVYLPAIRSAPLDRGLLTAAALAAIAGAVLGSLLLEKVSARFIEASVAALLFCVAAGLASGLL